MRSGVQPCHAAAHHGHIQSSTLQVLAIHVRDLQLAADRGFQSLRDLDYFGIVEVQTCNRVARLRRFWLLFQAKSFAPAIELNHAISLWILHWIGEYPRAAFTLG